MNYNNIEMRILIKGKPITEYAHNGQLFIEGRHNSSYEIELVNHNSFSVEAIVSVDGLSVIDGKDAGPGSSGYLLKARETIRIPGWKLNDSAGAKFGFAGKGNSYASQTGSARNTGVIGFLAYREKPQPQPQLYAYAGNPFLSQGTAGGYVSPSYSGVTGIYNGLTTFISNGVGAGMTSSDSWGGSGIGSLETLGMVGQNCISNGLSIGDSFLSASATCAATSEPKMKSMSAIASAAATVPQNNLGTKFGAETAFETTTATFERGDLHGMAVVYYDDAVGLKARGIVLQRSKPKRSATATPDAFPGMNCRPPAGWTG